MIASRLQRKPPGIRPVRAMRMVPMLVASCCMAWTAGHAAVTQSDLLIAARALSFLRTPMVGEVRVGIVYAPDNARSFDDAQMVLKMFGDGLKVGNLVLKPVLVKITELPNAQIGLIFLTDGLGTAGAAASATSLAKHVPCATVDIAQVKNGNCLMGVRSQPKIEILVNHAVATASGVEFSAIFRMMITEI
jgi:hypothetical protein